MLGKAFGKAVAHCLHHDGVVVIMGGGADGGGFITSKTGRDREAADAAKMIEFIVLDIEARRSDYLRHLHYDVQIKDGPHLVLLPADGRGLMHRH